MYKPPRPKEPTVNVREMVKTDAGCEELMRLMSATGYRVQEDVFKAFVLATRLGWPWMLSGRPGGGKTQFALALIEACNMPHAWLQGLPGKKPKDVLGYWNRVRQNQFVVQTVGCGKHSFDEADRLQWGAKFYKKGPVLDAFDYAAREERLPALVIDEEDKLAVALKDTMLEVFQQGSVHVEELEVNDGYVGFAPGQDRSRWPVIIITSNEDRHSASSPFRSRCVYTPMRLPDAREQVVVVRSQYPDAPRELVRGVLRMFSEIQSVSGFKHKPGLRECLAFMLAMTVYGRVEITPEVVREFAGTIAKYPKDFKAVWKADDRLAQASKRALPAVDRWVDVSFDEGLDAIPVSSLDEIDFGDEDEAAGAAGGKR